MAGMMDNAKKFGKKAQNKGWDKKAKSMMDDKLGKDDQKNRSDQKQSDK